MVLKGQLMIRSKKPEMASTGLSMNVNRPFFTWIVTSQKRRTKRVKMDRNFLCFTINPGIRFSRFPIT
jgi:hypothetical protein